MVTGFESPQSDLTSFLRHQIEPSAIDLAVYEPNNTQVD